MTSAIIVVSFCSTLIIISTSFPYNLSIGSSTMPLFNNTWALILQSHPASLVCHSSLHQSNPLSCSRIRQKRKRTPLVLPSLSNLLPELLTDIFSQVVQDNGMEEYFKLVRVSSKCKEIVKSPLVLQSIKFEELPLREDRSPPVQHFISTLQRQENPDVLYLEEMKLAFGSKPTIQQERGWSCRPVSSSVPMPYTLSAC